MSTETETQEVVQSNNASYNQSNMLQLRLDTDRVTEKIETFLRGYTFSFEATEDGTSVHANKIKIGEPKANDLGIQAMLSFVTSIVNSQTVQGNFKTEAYENYIYEAHTSLTDMLVINCYKWEIDDDDLDVIIDFILLLIQPFISRLVDNKERDSYSNTMKHTESNTMQAGGGFPNLFSRK